MGVLDGITVLEICEVYQGPLASQTLADFGARVIKIERPEIGDSLRGVLRPEEHRELSAACFAAANRNKESICLDLKSEVGLAALLRLVESADVLVHNMRPLAMERLGINYERLAERNPRLIYACASGYGDSGPLAEMAGQDFLIQAISGLATKTTAGSTQPRFTNAPIADFASGMLLAQGVLLALIERGKSGLGQQVSISLFDTAVAMQSLEAASELNCGYEMLFYEMDVNFTVEASDGWLLILGFFRENPLRLICEALAIPDLSAEPGFNTKSEQIGRRAEIVARLGSHFRKLTVDEVVRRLQKAGVLAAPILTFAQTLASAQVDHNGMILTVPMGDGAIKVLDHPLRLSRTPQQVRQGPPRLGADTRRVLGELGLSEAEIASASAGTA